MSSRLHTCTLPAILRFLHAHACTARADIWFICHHCPAAPARTARPHLLRWTSLTRYLCPLPYPKWILNNHLDNSFCSNKYYVLFQASLRACTLSEDFTLLRFLHAYINGGRWTDGRFEHRHVIFFCSAARFLPFYLHAACHAGTCHTCSPFALPATTWSIVMSDRLSCE